MKKIVLISSLVIVLITAAIWVLFFRPQNNSLSNPSVSNTAVVEIKPSETLIQYVDPAGFSFNYPDNLSITNQEIEDDSTYASLILNANGVNGSLRLEISDSKFKTIEEWLKLNQGDSKEVKLGNIQALEVKTKDRLLLGALDQGILFTIEMPLLQEQFWTIVYNKILSDFAFAAPESTNSSAVNSSEDISFEGEEVIE